MKLDDHDRKLLAEIQTDATLGSEELGHRIGLSASAVQRRLKILKKNRIISAERAVLNQSALGYPLTLFAMLELERESSDNRAKLRKWCVETPEIQQAYMVTGSTDVMLVVIARDIAEYDNLMSILQEKNPAVRKINTNVTLEVFKNGQSIPVPV